MNPSFRAFAEELMLIKAAETEDAPPTLTPESAPVISEEGAYINELPVLLKERLKGTLAFGAGAGLGSALGFTGMHYLLPKIIKRPLTPGGAKAIDAISGGIGLLTPLLMSEANRLIERREDDALKRYRSGI